MAKYERHLEGDFYELLNWVHHDIINGSISATYEDGSDYTAGSVKVAVRVYERYSMLGKNRNLIVRYTLPEVYINISSLLSCQIGLLFD